MAKFLTALFITSVLVCLLPAEKAGAQCYVFADAVPSAYGIEPGCDFTTSGALRPGAIGGMYHAYHFKRFEPDLEAYLTLSWFAPRNWLAIGFFGGGYTRRAHDWVPSGRFSLAVMRTTRASPFFNVGVIGTPEKNGIDGSVFFSLRIGWIFRLVSGVSLVPGITVRFATDVGFIGVGPFASLIWSI